MVERALQSPVDLQGRNRANGADQTNAKPPLTSSQWDWKVVVAGLGDLTVQPSFEDMVGAHREWNSYVKLTYIYHLPHL